MNEPFAAHEKWKSKFRMIREEPEERYTDEECETLFSSLFPNGFAGEDVLAEIAPEGWAQSNLHFVFHPTLDQIYWERVQLHRNLLIGWPWRDQDEPCPPEPTMEEVRASHQHTPLEIVREVRELAAMCLWDVFSDGHDIVDRDDRLVDLGSFRGTAGFLADQLNRETRELRYDYMDFYMGSVWVSERADLTPVYEMIFRRLRGQRLDWHYHFPRVRLVDYAADQRDGKESYQLEKMRAELRQAHLEAIEGSKLEPVPDIVLSYKSVYGAFPHGWPPWEFELEDD